MKHHHCSPPLISPTQGFHEYTLPRPAMSEGLSEVASALDTCDLDSILCNISWLPPEIDLRPCGDFKMKQPTRPGLFQHLELHPLQVFHSRND